MQRIYGGSGNVERGGDGNGTAGVMDSARKVVYGEGATPRLNAAIEGGKYRPCGMLSESGIYFGEERICGDAFAL